jgi:hypothetical protein
MITYRAMYKFLPDGVHGEVIDYPGVMTCGSDLGEARRLLARALAEMAESDLIDGRALPRPNPAASDDEADLQESIHLVLQGATRVLEVVEDAVT